MRDSAFGKCFVVALGSAAVLVAAAGARGANCAGDSVGRTPIGDLRGGSYLGLYEGGLYPGGSNEIPAFHAAEGLARARQIQPRDTAGNPDPAGNYVLLAVGMSNTTMEFARFMRDALDNPHVDLSRLVLVDGAAGGQAALRWTSASARNYDRIRDTLLIPNGLGEAQVQVVWLKVANARPEVGLPSAGADAFLLTRHIGDISRALATRYPNLKMVFVSSRIYAGYATSALNPEPFAYESGFAVKWVIEAQIRQMLGLGFDPTAGDLDSNTAAPWLAWGPYLWADGLTARADGLTWACADFAPDGTHPGPAGTRKVSSLLLDFFLTSPVTAPWFRLTGGETGAIAVLAPNGGERLDKNVAHTIAWSSTGDVGPAVSISLLRASGRVLLASSTPNDGEFAWAIPASLPEGDGYRVEVRSVASPGIGDTSDGAFSVVSSVPGSITVTSPNGGETLSKGVTETVTWTSSGGVGAAMRVRLLKGNNALLLTPSTPNDGAFEFVLPAWLPETGGYLLEVRSVTNPVMVDTSDATFAVGASP